MKKSVGVIVAIACLILGLFCFLTLRSSVSSQPNLSSDQIPIKSIAAQRSANDLPRAKRWPRAAKGDAAPEAIGKRIVSHQPKDFENGSPENTIVTDGLQMGNNPAFVSRQNPNYPKFGLYISPEESYSELFDVITPNLETIPHEGGELTFEFRTRPPGRDWTVWEQVTDDRLNQPFHLDAPAAAWQYRLTFYANDSETSPKVMGVKMQTQAAKNLAAAENQNDLPVNTQ